MKKLKFSHVTVEITRKCNLLCTHCMRGEAQDLTISQDILDNFFSQVEAIDEVFFTGGEPLLELDMIDYVVDCIAKYNVKIERLALLTNGTIKDRRILDIYNKFLTNGHDRTARLTISDDDFHNRKTSKEANEFYKKYNTNQDIWINVAELEISALEGYKHLVYAGRAVDLINKNKKSLIEKNYIFTYPFSKNQNHRIHIDDDGFIGCAICLLANGNVGYDNDIDYHSHDLLSFGNIANKPLYDVIHDFNHGCLLLCEECDAWSSCMNPVISGRFEPRVIDVLLVQSLQLKYVKYVRSMLVDKHKITAEEAIKKFPYINDNAWIKEIDKVINMNMDRVSRLSEKDKGTYADAATLWILNYMDRFLDGERLRPYYLFGQIEDLDKIVAHRRSQLKDIETEGKNE